MLFIDKIYFKIYKAYKHNFKSDMPEIYAISYIVVMFAIHVLMGLKILNLLGIETDISGFSKIQKLLVLVSLQFILGVRYYRFFDPIKFEQKHGYSPNYLPIILYTGLFLIAFFVLVLVF